MFTFIVYHLTVQRSIPFWDCGEFIACSAILGIPHPPGTPLFVLIGRLAAALPFADDVSYRINYISVIASSFTALFSYLLTVKLIGYIFNGGARDALGRYITYLGGICGGLLVAFSQTNWGNSVEAEVYGFSLALMVLIILLTIQYFENRGTAIAVRNMVLVFFLALIGVGIHMTTFLVVPMAAIFFLLKDDAGPREFFIVCAFIVMELLTIMLFSGGRGGVPMFYLISAIFTLILFGLLYRKINWMVAVAMGCVCSIMISFEMFLILTPVGLLAIVVLGSVSRKFDLRMDWRPALAIIVVALIGFSVHLYLPIRSSLNPRIDENHPARDYKTFVDFLDRKQYGSESMVNRMFHRRGTWENQFFRHPHMGFWSYFEDQYTGPGLIFVPFFALGMIGMFVAIRKRLEIGLPFFTLFLLCSAGLILYMNFADGIKYDYQTGDAYLEVRDRDYFFTPAFVFFGIAIGVGIGVVIQWIRNQMASRGESAQRAVVYACTATLILPGFGLVDNFHTNDRSNNILARVYAQNLLDNCDKDAILFTSGDNDTFPVWALQEAYNYRKDVKVVNLSLLQTDWYVAQMKNHYGVPISLSDEQILWYPFELRPGLEVSRPRKPFNDRPRGRETYLFPGQYGNSVIRVSDMMVDEITIENKWRSPIFFSSPPYAESPLKLRDRATLVGSIYRLDNRDPYPNLVDADKSFDLYMNTFKFTGLENSNVFRDENATGVYVSLGVNALRIYDELLRKADTTRAITLAEHMISQYPEYWQTYMVLGELYDRRGDSSRTTQLYRQLSDTLTAFLRVDDGNLFYRQDLGLTKVELGRRLKDESMINDGLKELWAAFEGDPNSSYGFRKLISALSSEGKYQDMKRAAEKFADYKVNRSDPYVQKILGISAPQGISPDE